MISEAAARETQQLVNISDTENIDKDDVIE